MKGDFRTLLEKYCLEGSVLGLKYFYLYPDRVSRCYWAITMLLNLGVACLLSFLLYRRFNEMPTRITIDNNLAPMHEMPYPAITICSPNQITISAMDHFKRTLVNGNITIDINRLIPQVLGFVALLNNVRLNGLQELQDIIEKNRYSALTVISSLPQQCDQFMRRCIFQRKIYPCHQLFSPILTQNGMCCIFNSVYHFKNINSIFRNERKTNFVKKKVSATGYANKLSVVVDYDPDNAFENSLLNAGATRVMLTDWTEFPANDESSLFHAGAEAFYSMSVTYNYCSEEVQQLPVSSRKCYFNDEYALPHFEEYHNTDCDLSCLVSAVESQCGCTMMYVPFVGAHRACNFTTLPCIKTVKLKMSDLYKDGRCDCIRNCESRSYSGKLTIGNLQAIEHLAHNPYSDIQFNKSTSLMHFYFPTSVYVKQKQETVISLTTIMSNLGGVFGLCLGCSFISLIELCFYIYVAIKNHIKEGSTNRSRKKIGYYN